MSSDLIKKENKERGFLLIEVIVATALFVIIVFISLGAIVSIMDSSRRVRANKNIMDDLNASVEYMARVIRFGTAYHCGGSLPLTQATSCALGDNQVSVQFKKPGATGPTTHTFSLNGTRLQINDGAGASYLTGTDVRIDYLRFYVFGAENTDDNQPFAVAVIRGSVASDPNARFDIETSMSQRRLDLAP